MICKKYANILDKAYIEKNSRKIRLIDGIIRLKYIR